MDDVLAAARSGNEEHLIALLQSGFPVDGTDREGFTALHKACARDHYGCAKVLIAHGANVNAASRTGWTPLLKVRWGGRGRSQQYFYYMYIFLF
jgi:ankyrin repeat protein